LEKFAASFTFDTTTFFQYVAPLSPKAKGRKTLKENQGEKGLYKHREAKPSRGRKPRSQILVLQDGGWAQG
jgi:hypothetical protein